MMIPAMVPAGRPGVDEVFAGAEVVDAGSEVEFDRNRERTSSLVHCIDEFEFLQ